MFNPNDLVERYLQAIRFWLPGRDAEDIIAEIREDLVSQIAEREMTEDEVVAMLQKRGSPPFVASQYAQFQPLIGAQWMPTYWFVLRVAILWILVPVHLFILGPIRVALRASAVDFYPIQSILSVLGGMVQSMLMAAAVITCVFVLLQRMKQNIAWDPRTLPRLSTAFRARWSDLPLSKVLSDFAGGAISSLLWGAFLWSRDSFVWNVGGLQIGLGPVWDMFAWPAFLAGIAILAVSWLRLAWPGSRIEYLPWLSMAAEATAFCVTCGLLATGGPWVSSPNPQIEVWSNVSMRIGLIVAIAIQGWELWRRVHHSTRRHGLA
jgi:hypothetical protein